MTKTVEFIKACHSGDLIEAKRLLSDADINGAKRIGKHTYDDFLMIVS